MKGLLFLSFALVSMNTTMAQSFNEFAYADQYKSIKRYASKSQNSPIIFLAPTAIERAEKLRNTGIALTFIGIAEIAIAAVITIPTLNQTTTTTCNPCTVSNDPTSEDVVTGVLFGTGVGATATGIVLWVKGSRRMKAFSDLSFNVKGKGAVIRYRF